MTASPTPYERERALGVIRAFVEEERRAGTRFNTLNAEAVEAFILDVTGAALPPWPSPAPEPVRVWPENFWREVWHDGCPKRGPMKGHREETLTIEDGSVLTRFECLGCGANCYAGLDSQRRIVSRPYPTTPPICGFSAAMPSSLASAKDRQ